MIQAKVIGASGPVPILQRGRIRRVQNGDMVKLTIYQAWAAQLEAPGLLIFQCPSCRLWYERLHGSDRLRLCENCIEWRAPKQGRQRKARSKT